MYNIRWFVIIFILFFEHDFRINIEKRLSYLRSYAYMQTIISHDEYIESQRERDPGCQRRCIFI